MVDSWEAMSKVYIATVRLSTPGSSSVLLTLTRLESWITLTTKSTRFEGEWSAPTELASVPELSFLRVWIWVSCLFLCLKR